MLTCRCYIQTHPSLVFRKRMHACKCKHVHGRDENKDTKNLNLNPYYIYGPKSGMLTNAQFEKHNINVGFVSTARHVSFKTICLKYIAPGPRLPPPLNSHLPPRQTDTRPSI